VVAVRTFKNDIDMNGNGIKDVKDPVLPTDAATKKYVDSSPYETLVDGPNVVFTVDGYRGGVLHSVSQATQFGIPTFTPTDERQYILIVQSLVPQALSFVSGVSGSFGGGRDISLNGIRTSGGGLVDYFGFQFNPMTIRWHLLAKQLGY